MYIWANGAEASLFKALIVEDFYFFVFFYSFDYIIFFCFFILTFLSKLSIV